MKAKISLVLSIVLLLTTIFVPCSVSAEGSKDDTLSSETGIAEKVAGEYIDRCAIFDGYADIELSDGEEYYNLNGEMICYVFGITGEGKYIGRVVVGGAPYYYDVLEAGTGAYPYSQAVNRNSIVKNDYIKLVYLGYGQFYAVFNDGGKEYYWNLLRDDTGDASALVSALVTPEKYRGYKNDFVESSSGKDSMYKYSNPLPVPLQQQLDLDDCGPTSGAMIAEYWKTWCPDFYSWSDDHDALYTSMLCSNWGLGINGTAPWYFGPGFEEYAADRGYNNFNSDWCLNRGYDVIQAEIDAGRPMGVMFSYFSGYGAWHWCVIKGYTGDNTIIVNNPNGSVGYINWSANKETSTVTRIYRT